MMRIYDLQVNHLNYPIGFRMVRTAFSWKVDGAKGKKQAAARVRIAQDALMNEILVDTGMDVRADSLGTRVNLEVKPRTRYYWTVTVKTDAGEEETSEVQFFETGKMGEAWKADWISCDNK